MDSPGLLQPLTTREVLSRLESGKTVEEIFHELLGEGDPELLGQAAREILYNRLYYMKTTLGLPTPTLPPLEELKSHVHR